MAVTLALQSVDSTRRRIKRVYKATFAGDYTALGDVLDFSEATDPFYLGRAKPGFGAKIAEAEISLLNPNGNGYVYRLEKGATLNASLIRVYEAGADGGDLDEVATAALPAAVTADENVFVVLTLPIGKA